MASCSQARPLSPTHAAIIGGYLIIFKPLMESFSTGRKARLCRGSAQSRDARDVLETLCQCHIPGSPPDVGRPLVVAVFEIASNEGRCEVKDVVYAESNCGVIQPRAPSTWIVLRCRDRHDVLSLAVFQFRVLAAVPGISGDFVLRRRSRQIKRVVDDQIQCRPLTDLASQAPSVPILPNVVDDRAGIESAEIVKHARIPAVSRERAKSGSTEYVGTINLAFRRGRLPYIPSQVVAIDGEHECSKATAAEYRGIQLIGSLVIETFGDDSLHVL